LGPKSFERVPETANSWSLGQETGYAVFYHFPARYIGCDDRPPTQHGLDDGQG
jgi:hypothetical protein